MPNGSGSGRLVVFARRKANKASATVASAVHGGSIALLYTSAALLTVEGLYNAFCLPEHAD